ncbi:MAG: chitobiase/beta-hexosaminidase C-terminal domain-containing protein [Candidatus Zixiibacteriota bacterium]|nr:MAG: chitobiase/beta-hexosaminidase C-terminal domain-containing protein [candidate division Zixibacteria bacterium]
MRLSSLLLALLISAGPLAGAQDNPQTSKSQLYVVGTAHLDTQWRWTILKTIDEFIPATFHENTFLMDQFSDYVFSFEGAFRYALLKEYYPEEYERLKEYIASGRWRVTGSWVDAVDVNVPSFESLVRQTLYGNGYFKREFGKTSRDIFLPDCFGFGYALPSIAAHCGLESFSSQKLTWGSWVGVPFDIGIWEGVDGSTIAAALNPGAYVSRIRSDLSRDTAWINAAERQGDSSGLYAAFRYFGTGDTGGGPDSVSVDWLQQSIRSDGPLRVSSVGADDLVDLVSTVERGQLPHYRGELLMTRHGVGCYTSQSAMKRWNRKNELLADATERASVIAHRLGGLSYPNEMLRDAWIRFLWHQFHDDLTGTSIPEAYEFSWNDELLSLNRFAAMLEHAVGSTVPALDTRCDGIPLVVYNPLSIEREDVVEATVYLADAPENIRVFDPDGVEVPSNVLESWEDSLHICFLASVPSVGYAVYDVWPTAGPSELHTNLSVTSRTLENERYLVRVDEAGDVSSIYDKQQDRELLAYPITFEFLTNTPKRWPAWEIDYDDIMAPANEVWVGEPVISIKENGRTRVALEIERRTEQSVIRTVVRLSAGGASDRVEFDNEIDWYERETLLKASVVVTTPADSVSYDLGLGSIKRGLNQEDLYEVPGHQWADLTSPDNEYGVAVLNDCRYGWDHPTPDKLRLTLVHTPGVEEDWNWVGDERSQDNGRHSVQFAVMGHTGDWRDGNVAWEAARLNHPLRVFQAEPHEGALGKRYSLVDVTPNSAVMVNAVKLAEESDEIVLRVRELTGRSQNEVVIEFDRPVLTAREVSGAEDDMGPAQISNGRLIFSLTSYQPKAFAVTLEAPLPTPVPRPAFAKVDLPYNLDGVSLDTDRCDGDFDGQGNSLVGELLPDNLIYRGIPFDLGPTDQGALNAVSCDGQTILLPEGPFDRLFLLAAAVNGPAITQFSVDEQVYTVSLQDYADPIGQWNNRMVAGTMMEEPSEIAPAYINRMPVAWYGSHRHTADCENDTYKFTYLFLVSLELPENAESITLPDNSGIRVMAATAADQPYTGVQTSWPLYDATRSTLVRVTADSSAFAGQATFRMSSPVVGTAIYYTLDGTEPTTSSLLYTEPVSVAQTTTIKARGFKEGTESAHIASKTVTKLTLEMPVLADAVAPGLHCKYYEGEWSLLPDFDTVAVVSTFIADTVAIPERATEEDFGLVFTGYVNIQQDGVYALSINSDDGSRLYLHDSLLIDNDGLHGDHEMTALVGLEAGYHPIRLNMFQCKGDQALGMSVAGPSLSKQTVPASMLFHAE